MLNLNHRRCMKWVTRGVLALWLLSASTTIVHAQEASGTPLSREEGVEKALHDLQASDHGVKCDAVARLARRGDPGYIDKIVVLLDDPDARVRRCALHGLSGLKPVQYRERFLALLADQDGYVRSAAAEALGSCGVRADAPKLVPLLQDEERWARVEAMRALAALGAKDYAPEIATHLKAGSTVRGMAALTLGKLGASTYVKDIAELLGSDQAYDLQAAMEALAELHAQEYAPKIAARLTDGGAVAVKALARLGAKEYADDIANLLQQQNDYAVMALGGVVAEALAEFGAREYTAEIVTVLKKSVLQDGTYANFLGAREGATKALVKLAGSDGYAQILAGFLTDESEAVRAYGAYALGKLGATPQKKAIAALLDDEHPDVIACAVWALGTLDAREYTEKLSALLNHSGSIDPLSASWLTDAFGMSRTIALRTIVAQVLDEWKMAQRENLHE